MLYHYQNYSKQKRRKRRLIKATLILCLLIMVALSFVLKDVFKEAEIESRDSGEVRSIQKSDGYLSFEEDKFTLSLPPDWQRDDSSNKSYIKYKSGQQTKSARTLEIYINNVPVNYDTTRAVKIDVVDGRILSGLISERCHNFTKPKEGFGDDIISPSLPAIWQGASFNCNFSKSINRVSTVNSQTGFSTNIAGPTSSASYLFAYTDHTSRPDLTIFINILTSFEHK